jgi:hypothetical protein
MIRANNKDELIGYSQKYFQEILDFINGLPEEIKTRKYTENELNERDKTISDVITHLYEWHMMLENWYKTGMKGKKPAIPMEGYNWKQLTDVNRIIYEKYEGTDVKDAIRLFKSSHKRIMKLIEKHNNKELFESNPYEWTEKTTLGRYFDSNMLHHYQWGLKIIKRLNKFVKKIKR